MPTAASSSASAANAVSSRIAKRCCAIDSPITSSIVWMSTTGSSASTACSAATTDAVIASVGTVDRTTSDMRGVGTCVAGT